MKRREWIRRPLTLVFSIGTLTLLGFLFLKPSTSKIKPESNRAIANDSTAVDPSLPRRSRDAAIKDLVRRKNKKEKSKQSEYESALTADGWTLSQDPNAVAPPNENLLALEEDFVRKNPEQAKFHLLSNSFTGEILNRIYDIAISTKDTNLKYVALETLGRSPDVKSQDFLIEAYRSMDGEGDTESRSQILSYIKPTSLEDQGARFLFEILSNPDADSDTKRQAAFPLLMAGTLDPSISPNSDEKVGARLVLAARGILSRTPSGYQSQMRTLLSEVFAIKESNL